MRHLARHLGRHFRLAVLALWFGTGLAASAQAMFGPLWSSTPAAPACRVAGPMAQLPAHFMQGLVDYGPGNGRLDGGLWAHDLGIPLDAQYVYVNNPYSSSYVGGFVAEAYGYGQTPVLTFYLSGSGGYYYFGQNPANFPAYYNNFQNMMQTIAGLAGAKPTGVAAAVVDIEPDSFGFLQAQCECTNAGSVAAYVSSGYSPVYSGVAGWSALPNTVAGLMQGLAMIRNTYAPNVILAYHMAPWAGGHGGVADNCDPVLNPGACPQAGQDVGAWYNSAFGGTSLHWDAFVSDVSDSDSAFNDVVCGGQQNIRLWWGANSNGHPDNTGQPHGAVGVNNFAAWAGFINGFATATGLKGWAWQVPVGNTVMQAQDDDTYTSQSMPGWPNVTSFGGTGTPGGGHFQDDRAQYWLEPQIGNPHLAPLIGAGLVGILWGAGQLPGLAQCNGDGNGMGDTAETDIMGQGGPYNPGVQALENANAAGTFPTDVPINGTEWSGTGANIPEAAGIADNDGGFLRNQLLAYYRGTGADAPPAVCP